MSLAGPGRFSRPSVVRMGRIRTLSLAVAASAVAAACEDTSLTLPAEADLEGLYGEAPQVALNGNVVDVHVVQDRDQLRRGGKLWARVGPYIYLFSPQTKELFENWSGLGGVRVRTFTSSGTQVAEAMLRRGDLNGITWRRALRLVSQARLEGTRRPSFMENLVRYGEETAQFEYNSDFAGE
ncbi:MAG: hypothetical protein V3U67_02645 [Gemmatimonadota bacterium]